MFVKACVCMLWDTVPSRSMTGGGSAALGGDSSWGGVAAAAATGAEARGAGDAYVSKQGKKGKMALIRSNLNPFSSKISISKMWTNTFFTCIVILSRLTDMQKSSRSRNQASLHPNCVSTSLNHTAFGSTELMCMCMQTPAPCKETGPSRLRLFTKRRKGTVMQER